MLYGRDVHTSLSIFIFVDKNKLNRTLAIDSPFQFIHGIRTSQIYRLALATTACSRNAFHKIKDFPLSDQVTIV